jgi:hypothetical protein
MSELNLPCDANSDLTQPRWAVYYLPIGADWDDEEAWCRVPGLPKMPLAASLEAHRRCDEEQALGLHYSVHYADDYEPEIMTDSGEYEAMKATPQFVLEYRRDGGEWKRLPEVPRTTEALADERLAELEAKQRQVLTAMPYFTATHLDPTLPQNPFQYRKRPATAGDHYVAFADHSPIPDIDIDPGPPEERRSAVIDWLRERGLMKESE